MTEPFMYIEIPGLEHHPHVTYTWVIMILLGIATFVVRGSISMIPTGLQNLFEVIIVNLADFMDQTIGHNGRRFMPLIGTLTLFIVCSNLIAIVPGCNPPTSNINTNLGMALTVMLLYHTVGLRKHGFAYFKQFMGPVWWLVPLMLPIEIISHIARPLTLTMRLFGNIKGEDLVMLVLLFLIPLLLPLPMMAFMVFTSILQTLVFILLTMVYLQGALSDEH